MPFFELPPVTPLFKFCTFLGWDGGLSAIFIDIVDNLPAVIATVSQYITVCNVNVFQYRYGISDITALPFADYNTDGITISVNCRMYFRAVLTLAVADFI